VLVLADQLDPRLSSLVRAGKDDTVVLMVEVLEETAYAWHHKKKIAFLFSAMRHFAADLRQDGWTVDYVELNAAENTGSFGGEVSRALLRHGADRLVVTHPGEHRVLEMALEWRESLGVPVEILRDERFICSRRQFTTWAEGRAELRMEYFYRDMRRQTGLLMDRGRPLGGRWNFDSANRRPIPSDVIVPDLPRIEPDAITRDVLDLVVSRLGDHFGDLEPFWFAVTREDAERLLDHFLAHALPRFGDYQDAMRLDAPFVFHSVLSPYINCGLLDPLEVCRRVEIEHLAGRAPLNAAEGFIRQIIGWREYVRGVYWLKMPDYAQSNVFAARRKLPGFYWTAETDMACVRACVSQTISNAYAHHIQRLMITGNFALLAGIDPHQLHQWYLAVYADAYEWVEMPNTLGMSQFADGGLLASKPYAASGNYINRMSD
jgi:deoxyribodipyrimidine photolyase-related protein